MADTPFSNREITTFFQNIENKLDQHTQVHDTILKQVTYTNGRVRWNEKMIYMALGALIILVPIFTWFIGDYVKFKETYQEDLSSTVEETLNGYELQITK